MVFGIFFTPLNVWGGGGLPFSKCVDWEAKPIYLELIA